MCDVNLLLVGNDRCVDMHSISSHLPKEAFNIRRAQTIHDAIMMGWRCQDVDVLLIDLDAIEGDMCESVRACRICFREATILAIIDSESMQLPGSWNRPTGEGCPLIKNGADGVILKNATGPLQVVKEVMTGLARRKQMDEAMLLDIVAVKKNLNGLMAEAV